MANAQRTGPPQGAGRRAKAGGVSVDWDAPKRLAGAGARERPGYRAGVKG